MSHGFFAVSVSWSRNSYPELQMELRLLSEGKWNKTSWVLPRGRSWKTSRMKYSPWCSLGSKQPSCKCLLHSSEAVGNTQTMSLYASEQEISAENAGREKAPSFCLQCCWNSDLKFQTLAKKFTVSLECTEIHIILIIKHRYHQHKHLYYWLRSWSFWTKQ